MKKITSIMFLCGIMLFAAMGIASAQGGSVGELAWNFNEETGTLTINGEGAIPDYNYETDILPPWEHLWELLTAVDIGNGVTSIGNMAFSDFYELTSVDFPSSVTSIGKDAFYSCTGLSSITLPEFLTTIGEFAFGFCESITSITLGNTVTSVGTNAFMACYSLASIEVAAGNPNYASENGVLFNKDKTTLVQCPGAKSGAYTIPESVTVVGQYAFCECPGLTSITIPNSVITVENAAFNSCTGITSLTIGNSVTTIKDGAFSNCSGLTSVTIPNSVKTMEGGAFAHCTGLTSVTISESLTTIAGDAFYNCTNLTSVVIPSLVTTVGSYAFYNCSGMTSITIPNSVISIGNYAFSECSGLPSVTIPGSVILIGEGAFAACISLTEITNLATTPQAIEASVFNGVNTSACTLRVPEGSQEAYRTAAVWKGFLNIEGITVGINNNIFAGITVYSSGNTVYIVNKNSVNLKSVQIIDMQGRVVYDGRGRTFSTPTEEIPVNGANGIYVVRIVSDDNKVSSAKVHLDN